LFNVAHETSFFLVKIISQVNGQKEKVGEERCKVMDSDEEISQ